MEIYLQIARRKPSLHKVHSYAISVGYRFLDNLIFTSFFISAVKVKLFLKTKYTEEYRFLTNCSQRISYFLCCHRNGSYQTQLFTMYDVYIIGADIIAE